MVESENAAATAVKAKPANKAKVSDYVLNVLVVIIYQ